MTIDGPLTLDCGECAIQADSVAVQAGSSANIPNRLGLPNRSLGGGDYYYATGSNPHGQQGITGGSGLNNIGLLITTWGNVTYAGSGFFYVDDGSLINDGSGYVGVKVYSAAPVVAGQFVSVTGISGCEQSARRKRGAQPEHCRM